MARILQPATPRDARLYTQETARGDCVVSPRRPVVPGCVPVYEATLSAVTASTGAVVPIAIRRGLAVSASGSVSSSIPFS